LQEPQGLARLWTMNRVVRAATAAARADRLVVVWAVGRLRSRPPQECRPTLAPCGGAGWVGPGWAASCKPLLGRQRERIICCVRCAVKTSTPCLL